MIPGTDTPVSINNVNGGNPFGSNASNPDLFNNNDLTDGGPFFDIEYDGFTDVFTAEITGLDPGTNNIKIAIADAGDSSFDSAVFIEGGTFSSTPNPVIPNPEQDPLNPIPVRDPFNPIVGTEGNDGLTGTDGEDELKGLGGNDVLEGKAGDDLLDGGAANDTVTYERDPAGVIVDLDRGLGQDGFGGSDTLIDIENLMALNSMTNSLVMRELTTSLEEMVMIFLMVQGEMILVGDSFAGSAGSDDLTGGAGNDNFVFISPDGAVDTIQDFGDGDDTILIVGAVFPGGLSGGLLSASEFFEGTEATEASHRFGYDASTGDVFFDEDGVGGVDADVLATLVGGTSF